MDELILKFPRNTAQYMKCMRCESKESKPNGYFTVWVCEKTGDVIFPILEKTGNYPDNCPIKGEVNEKIF
jgi:hypothetical protein